MKNVNISLEGELRDRMAEFANLHYAGSLSEMLRDSFEDFVHERQKWVASTRKLRDKYRVCSPKTGKVLRNFEEQPVDNAGYRFRKDALKHARDLNDGLRELNEQQPQQPVESVSEF